MDQPATTTTTDIDSLVTTQDTLTGATGQQITATSASSAAPLMFGGELPPPDELPITLEQLISVHPGLLRHQGDSKGPNEIEFDSDGVAVISPASWPDLDQDTPLRHPTVITRVANGTYARLLANPNDDESLQIHLRQARWLRDTLVWNEDGLATWAFPMALEAYGLGPGWTSAMTNGFGLAVLFQAATLVPAEEGTSFVEAANGVLKSFATHVDNGGVARPLVDGTICFEEVADPAKPHCILNGHNFAIGGIRVAAEIGSQQATELADAGIRYTAEHLENYDVGFGSLYSLGGKFAEPGGYNKVHVNQLLWLFYLTGSEHFYQKASDWSNFENDPQVTVVASDTIDPVDHGSEKLLDGAAWWGYWSSRADRVELSFSFGGVRAVCGVALFAVAESGMPFAFAQLTLGDEIFDLDPEVPVSTNSNNSGSTSAVSYNLDTCLDAEAATITLIPLPGQVLAMREVDFLLDRSDEVSELYSTLVKVYEYGRPTN